MHHPPQAMHRRSHHKVRVIASGSALHCFSCSRQRPFLCALCCVQRITHRNMPMIALRQTTTSAIEFSFGNLANSMRVDVSVPKRGKISTTVTKNVNLQIMMEQRKRKSRKSSKSRKASSHSNSHEKQLHDITHKARNRMQKDFRVSPLPVAAKH